MPKWKKDAKEFTVGVNFNEDRGYQSSIPKPIIDVLGDPEKITFVIDGSKVKIIPAKQNESDFIQNELENALKRVTSKGGKK